MTEHRHRHRSVEWRAGCDRAFRSPHSLFRESFVSHGVARDHCSVSRACRLGAISPPVGAISPPVGAGSTPCWCGLTPCWCGLTPCWCGTTRCRCTPLRRRCRLRAAPRKCDSGVSVDSGSPLDVASDRVTPQPDSGLFCTLPSGATCPAGSSCPAGDSCNTSFCPAAGGAARCTDRACPSDAGAGECTTASDCRLFESYCSTDPCACLALSRAAPDPRCSGAMVTCFAPPCLRHNVDCVAGRCVVR
jgi:hypothetical protein